MCVQVCMNVCGDQKSMLGVLSCCVGHTGWPASAMESLVSVFIVLALEVCTIRPNFDIQGSELGFSCMQSRSYLPKYRF